MLEPIIAAARNSAARIVLSEGEDARVIKAACRASADRLAQIVLLGREQEISVHGYDLRGVEIINPADFDQREEFAENYYRLRKHRGIDAAATNEAMLNPLNFAAMMVRSGYADGTVGGAVATTADTVRAAIQIIGIAEGAGIVSSFFLMGLSGDHLPRQGLVIFADCGLVADPNAGELCEIAIASADNFQILTGGKPKVAMLSFSTKGSARHASVSKMIEATTLVRDKRPDLPIDGELQFDAAFVPSVAEAKAPDSPLAGDANVFIFPDLNAGNIAYKIAQRIGGAKAIGPVLQGLAKPANDLSRGCSADDVYEMIALTALQAKNART